MKNCYWIGGLDLDQLGSDNDGHNGQRPAGETIMLSLSRKIQVVRVGEDARVFKVWGPEIARSNTATRLTDKFIANRLRWEHDIGPERLHRMRCRLEELCTLRR